MLINELIIKYFPWRCKLLQYLPSQMYSHSCSPLVAVVAGSEQLPITSLQYLQIPLLLSPKSQYPLSSVTPALPSQTDEFAQRTEIILNVHLKLLF